MGATLLASLLLVLGAPMSGAADTMPPFSDSFQNRAEFYKMAWMPDGYPGRRNSDGTITAHPLYGIYVIDDYARQLDADPGNQTLLNAIERVANAARNRMRPFKGTLVFWYEPAEFPSAFGADRYYSGLTQGYWANTFYEVYELTGRDVHRDAASRVFKSLQIPDHEGGVLERTPHGWSIAEYPARPRYMALNGWMSALISIHRYGVRAGVPAAIDLAHRSSWAMASMLPLYDAPHIRNSRYGIAGYQYARVTFSSQPALVRSVTFNTPSEGRFGVPVRDTSRFRFYVLPKDVVRRTGGFVPRTNRFHANLFVSRVAYPQRSSLLVRADVRRKTTVTVELAIGTYHPLQTSPRITGWRTVRRTTIAPGTSTVKTVIPWSSQHDVAHATNFAKVLLGKNTNVYHMIHLKRLREMYEITGNLTFREYERKWRAYVCKWPDMPIYKGYYVSYLGGMTPAEYCARTAPA